MFNNLIAQLQTRFNRNTHTNNTKSSNTEMLVLKAHSNDETFKSSSWTYHVHTPIIEQPIMFTTPERNNNESVFINSNNSYINGNIFSN